MAPSDEGSVHTPDTGDSTPLEQMQIATNSALENLQTDEQRTILDNISQVRKCGLENILSLPQIIVCGDQSAGKSSVLEALTEIPFPRNDNLCTRFATEISLRREPIACLTIRVIPDGARQQSEQNTIKSFSESITNFEALPAIMDKAMEVIGISSSDKRISGSAFAKDTLSIEIQGPDRPQLTLVDIPGLIQTSTKGVSEADVAIVAEITNSYIEQPRTICLAVVSATNDAANQPILQRVRKFDPEGERTLGVITKPDRLSPGSGSETKFLELARNEGVFFKLGWHVIKNRKFEETQFSIEERNFAEKTFFSASNFKTLPKENVGIDMLRVKLSHLLFDHVKKELPQLQNDLEQALKTAQKELLLLGDSRSTVAECRTFLARLNMDCHKLCQAGLEGNYRDIAVFKHNDDSHEFSLMEESTVVRIRAVVQYANTAFADEFRRQGHKYQFSTLSSDIQWASKAGRPQTTKPSKLFWEQSEPWEKLATFHIRKVDKLCEDFLSHLLEQVAPKDLKPRIWVALVQDVLKSRREAAFAELGKLMEDHRGFPINYNHYYTDTVHKKRQDRIKAQIQQHITKDPHEFSDSKSLASSTQTNVHKELDKIIRHWADDATPDMEKFSCEEALDCLMAIYKVQQKTFIANITTQVVERHLVRGLQEIFSPLVIVNMPDAKFQSIVSEPSATKRTRVFLAERVKKLEEGQEIFRDTLET